MTQAVRGHGRLARENKERRRKERKRDET